MGIYTEPNLSSGIDQALLGVSQTVPTFTIMMLVFIWAVIFIGGSKNQKNRTGSSDYPFWAVTSSMAIFIISLIMTLGVGAMSLEILGIVTALTILTGIWFFLSSRREEI